MKKPILVLVALLSAGCASGVKQTRILASAASGDIHDPKYSPYHFGNLTERFLDQMDAVPAQQKLAGAALMEAGDRCIDGWSQFGKDYPALEEKLAAETSAAKEAVKKMEGKLTWHYASATPEVGDEICDPEVEKFLRANLAVLNQLVVDLEIEEQNFETIQLSGKRRFGDEAGQSYGRNLRCPVKYRYDEVVTSAFSAVSNRDDLPISGFAAARLALQQYKLITVGEISNVNAALATIGTSCK